MIGIRLEIHSNAYGVPEKIFLSDGNRNSSIDRRTYGFIYENNIICQANFVLFHSNSNNGL